MNVSHLFGLTAAVLVGLGLYGLIVNPQPLRKILALNVTGNGVFLVGAVIAHRGAAAGMRSDPLPQALLITAIVVSFAASALGVALMLRGFAQTGRNSLSADLDGSSGHAGAGAAGP
jgi:multicomponent Na+:H+ antiporter subunit C